MFTCSKMLLLGTLTVCILVFAIGCDQPDDVVTLDSSAYVTLNPERLPSNPEGTMYELWVANDTDTLSLGQFGYDYDAANFLTNLDTDRPEEGTFFMDESIDAYDAVFVSVEPTLNDDETSPASIMLLDLIASPTIKLVVPLTDSLWSSTIRFNMKSTSDGIGNFNDGRSIWFANYRTTVEEIIDTVMVTWTLDSGEYVDASTILYDTNMISLDSIVGSYVLEPIGSLDAIDSVYRAILRFDTVFSIDSTDYYPTTLRLAYTTFSTSYTAERFSQDDFEVPNLQAFGWKYKGWVVSDAIPGAAVGNMTLPAWRFLSPIIVDFDGGLMTTGVFYDIHLPDNDSPFLDTTFRNPPRTPQFPGEDFLENLPAGLGTMPYLPGSGGHVFISLEPEFYTDSTNFPLVLFVGDVPWGGSLDVDHGFTLKGMTYTNDAFRGFPKIDVTIEKF